MTTIDHFYRDVPGLGHVAVSRHAQSRIAQERITPEEFERVLLSPIRPDVPDGQEIIWRERDGIRIVIILYPTPMTGARLVKTVYRVQPQANVHH